MLTCEILSLTIALNYSGAGANDGVRTPWGNVLSQHQHAFLADDKSEVARVARRVLSVLVAQEALLPDDANPVVQTQDPAGWIALTKPVFNASIDPDPKALTGALAALQNSGHSGAKIAFDLFPVVARQLGKAWEDDTISFADVTVGCARLQRALRSLTDDAKDTAVAPCDQRDCLVLLPDGAHHTFGAIILAKRLRHAGMRVTLDLAATPRAVMAYKKAHVFDAVLISASLSETSDILRPLVAAAHRQWPDSKVILGGTFQNHGPTQAAATGADHVTQDWQKALSLCI